MRWRIVPLLMLFVALAHFTRLSISVAGAEQLIRPGLLDERQMGLVYTAFLLSYTAFMVPGGWLTDRFGPRAAWMAVGFGSAAGVALTGLTGLAFTGPGALLAGLIGIQAALGACNAPLHPSGARIVANWVPPHGVSLANGLIGIAACTGIALTYLVFGALIDRFGWPQAFLISSGVTLWSEWCGPLPPRTIPRVPPGTSPRTPRRSFIRAATGNEMCWHTAISRGRHRMLRPLRAAPGIQPRALSRQFRPTLDRRPTGPMSLPTSLVPSCST
jgi:MFS family permease